LTGGLIKGAKGKGSIFWGGAEKPEFWSPRTDERSLHYAPAMKKILAVGGENWVS